MHRYGLWECRRFSGFTDLTVRYQGLIGQRALLKDIVHITALVNKYSRVAMYSMWDSNQQLSTTSTCTGPYQYHSAAGKGQVGSREGMR